MSFLTTTGGPLWWSKTLFLDFRGGKTHIGPKNNSKQLLRWWCYTHFFPFARKSRICDNQLSKNNFFHDLKFLNPTVLLCVILHQPIGHFSKKLRKKNSKTKIFTFSLFGLSSFLSFFSQLFAKMTNGLV